MKFAMHNDDGWRVLSLAGRDDTAVRYRWDDSSRASVAVGGAVARATGRDPTDLPPLQDSIDTDALDSLLGRRSDGPILVSLSYDGVDVLLRDDGYLEVRADDVEVRTDGGAHE